MIEVKAGGACWKPVTPTLGVQDWNGNTRTYQLDPGGPISRLQTPYLALSPAGTRIAGALKADPAGGYDTELFEDGVASGLFRPMDSDLAITLIGQQIYGAMSVRAAEPLPRPRHEVAAEICNFIVHGLGA